MKKWKKIGGSLLVSATILMPLQNTIANAQEHTSMSYINFVNPQEYIQYINRTQDSLNVVTPRYFELNKDGSLNIQTQIIDSQFIQEMHNRGIKVVPFFQNSWGDGTALSNRDSLSTQIADALQTYQLDGINIDIEGLNENSRVALVDFIKKVRSKIPNEKQVSIAVAANPNGRTTGWAGSYDYKQLNAALTGPNDYLMIMAYDEHTGTSVGPVASLPFVENSIKYALYNSQLSPNKIVLGIPFYGRLWKSDGTINGISASHWRVNEILKTYHGSVTMDSTSHTPKATFTIKSGDPTYSLNGQNLTPGNYTLWFDNEASIKEKLVLVQKYNLRGTGSWSLCQEDAQTWDYYKLWLNAQYFTDVLNHWAQKDIYAVNGRNWMVGMGGTTFSPDGPLTRAQAAKILVVAMGYSLTPTTPSAFTDTKGHWAEKYIQVAKEKGLVSGMTKTTFAPDEPLSREQAAQMLSNLLKYPNAPLPAQSPFKDVSPSQWSYQAIINMKENNVITGFPDGTFKPQVTTNRAQMAKLMNASSTRIDTLNK